MQNETRTYRIEPETAADGEAIERLYQTVFGPGRFALTAYRLREQADHRPDLAFVAKVGAHLSGSIRFSRIWIGDAKALLLGPLAIQPEYQRSGLGHRLIETGLKAAKAKGATRIILVGDLPYYQKSGFVSLSSQDIRMPGPVDPARLLGCALEEGAFDGVTGHVRPRLAN